MKKRLGLVYGGKSAEHEVSLSTAKAVTAALDLNKYEVQPIYITKQGQWLKGGSLTAPAQTIEELRLQPGDVKADSVEGFLQGGLPDVVLPLLHGTNGEDGTVQGLFEVLNIPYAGNGMLASSAGMDKVVMKQLFAQAGLAQVAYTHFVRSAWQADQEAILKEAEEKLRYPLFVKPANLGSSVGISKADHRQALIEAIELALKFDRKIIVEQGITAREIEMAVLGNDSPEVSVAGEIRPAAEFYDYEAKYSDQSTELAIPAVVPSETAAQMKEMAVRAFKVLDCAGLVRADFFVTAGNEVLINEVNTLPGFTPTSMFPLLWQKTGLAYPDLIDRLIELAEERYEEKQQLHYTMD